MLRAFQAYAQGECKQARRRASASGKGAGATASDGDGDVVQVSAASDGDGDVVQVSAASDGDGDVVQVSAASDGDGDSPAGFPKHVYLQGQRWGSGFPAPAFCQGRDEHGCGCVPCRHIANTCALARLPARVLPCAGQATKVAC